MKEKHKIRWWASMVLLLIADVSMAQSYSVTIQPSVVSSSVLIANRANQTLVFRVRPERGTWGSYSLDPGYNMEISCDDCTAEFFEFSMSTGDREVNYDLDETKRYVLDWNDQKELWDIFVSE